MNAPIPITAEALAERLIAEQGSERRLIAIAGAPGSGKSTLAKAVARRLNAQRVPTEVVPMDGFHLDNSVLDLWGMRARKGAPETFDAGGFLYLVWRMKMGQEVVAPLFDRARDLSVAGALVVSEGVQVVICEGNYLLFGESPWDGLAQHWDMSVRLEVEQSDLRARLIQRWLDQGLSRAAATRRAEGNDIPNALRVIAHALPADITLGADGTVHAG